MFYGNVYKICKIKKSAEKKKQFELGRREEKGCKTNKKFFFKDKKTFNLDYPVPSPFKLQMHSGDYNGKYDLKTIA